MKLATLVAAIVALAAGATCGVVGGIVAASDGPDRWFGTGFTSLETDTNALVIDPAEIADGDTPPAPDGGSRIQVGRRNNFAAGFEPKGVAVFLGVGPAAEVERYLDGVAREYVTDIDWRPLELGTTTIVGSRSPGPPPEQGFWVEQVAGADRQTIRWRIAKDQLLVVMQTDGAPKVAGQIAFSSGMEYFTALPAAVSAVGTAIFVAGVGLASEAFGPTIRRRRRG